MNVDYVGDAHGAIFWSVVGLIILIVHFIPSFVAFSRNHPKSGLILILNIFFGWTGIGWVILLLWALAKS